MTLAGPYDDHGDNFTFTETGQVTFSLSELGTLSADGFSFNSQTLSETTSLSWSLVVTDSGGATVQASSGVTTVTALNSDENLDPWFPQGFNWLPVTDELSSLNSLGLSDLAATSLVVTETGSDSYTLQEANGVATFNGKRATIAEQRTSAERRVFIHRDRR